ncbi:hypothetical protein B5F82_05065 [Megamonas hypermegale]|uniref:hypothetical protein n=1 Tax=Megamonas hypermegale TaxID=158847 RepID=UPI000B3B0122|nr:hypothetical protein [Megamonas hypermegale]OUO40279.1 hypothetical protein B5F82_05065 [Megamonas hypermegale]
MNEMQKKDFLYECDRIDCKIAVFSGIMSGIIDIVFVNMPKNSLLGKIVDGQTDNIVKFIAKQCGWKPILGKENNIASAIGFLEKKFPVNYDMSSANYAINGFSMAPNNHHLKSLAHSPSPIGLIFSILDQFDGKASFVSDGKLIRIDAETQTLRGNNLLSKIFCGFCNWIGHIISDMAGSSGGRGNVNGGRGSGVAIPFFELFQFCNFGSFQVGKDRQTLATLMTRVFQEGYDLRFGITMSIPVILNEMFIRICWMIKRIFYHKLDWKYCIPRLEYKSFHKMLLIGNAGLCLLDSIDAGIRSGGNALNFVLRLNLIAWGRLIVLVMKYLMINHEKTFYEKNHEKNMLLIQKINEYKLILSRETKVFLREQQIILNNNFKLIDISLENKDENLLSDSLNNIVKIFGKDLPDCLITFNNFDKFVSDKNNTFVL